MKFSVELNCAPNQNTRFSSSLQALSLTDRTYQNLLVQGRVELGVLATKVYSLLILVSFTQLKIGPEQNLLFLGRAELEVFVKKSYFHLILISHG